MRERSYASEPGSRIALKLDAEKETVDGQDKNDMNADDDDDDDTIECDVGVRTSTFSEPLDFGRRSQTLLDAQTPPATPPVVSVQQKKNPKLLLLAHSKKQKTKNQTSNKCFFTNIVFKSPVKCAANNNYNNKLAHTPLYILYILYIYCIIQYLNVYMLDYIEQYIYLGFILLLSCRC